MSNKLYTEKQVIRMLKLSRFTNNSEDKILLLFTPIELPSDEDIESYVKSTGYYGHCTHEYHEGIEEGAKWMRDKIGGNNEQE